MTTVRHDPCAAAETPIDVFRPTLGEEELAAVAEVFAGGWLGKGPRTDAFELGFAEHLGVPRERVRTVSCCTDGLFLAMELLDVGPGDEVVLPSISFVGAANAALARGARPVFCDVDVRTLNPRPEHIEALLSPRTRAVTILHYGGDPGHAAEIAQLCRDRRVGLVEDAACAVASRAPAGACGTLGDVGVWSFDAMKILVTGDGGMMHFRDPGLAARAERLMCLGLDAPSGSSRSPGSRWWELAVSEPGRRSLMNDVAAAIGGVQLRRLPQLVRRRAEVRARYDDGLTDLPGLALRPAPPPDHEVSDFFYWVQLAPPHRDALARHLRAREIYTTFKYHPLHTLRLYGSTGTRLPGAEQAAATTLCLPMHQALGDDDVDRVVAAVSDFVTGAG